MGKLVSYILRLTPGGIIDPDIFESIRNSSAIVNFSNIYWYYHSNHNDRFDFTYSRWIEGGICFSYLVPTADFVSTRFSGCRMARYIDTQNRLCGCHIHCGGKNDAKDRRTTWNEFILQGKAKHVVLFKPNINLLISAEQASPDDAFDLWGIITPLGQCYSVIVKSSAEFICSRYDPIFKAPVYLHTIANGWPEPSITIPPPR